MPKSGMAVRARVFPNAMDPMPVLDRPRVLPKNPEPILVVVRPRVCRMKSGAMLVLVRPRVCRRRSTSMLVVVRPRVWPNTPGPKLVFERVRPLPESALVTVRSRPLPGVPGSAEEEGLPFVGRTSSGGPSLLAASWVAGLAADLALDRLKQSVKVTQHCHKETAEVLCMHPLQHTDP